MKELSLEAVQYCGGILSLLKSFTDEDFMKAHEDADGNLFTIHQYVNDFIWHDQHHIGQTTPQFSLISPSKIASINATTEANKHIKTRLHKTEAGIKQVHIRESKSDSIFLNFVLKRYLTINQ